MAISFHSTNMQTDIIVIGSGVAGLSAAISGALAGFGVMVLERGAGPPERPGETLHPGLEPIFDQLGIKAAAERAATGRPRGIVFHDGQNQYVRGFGGPCGAPWHGYHIPRKKLHKVLLDRARQLGVSVRFECPARSVSTLPNGKMSVETETGDHICNWLLDASGPSNWLGRVDRARYRAGSRQLTVCYGYHKSNNGEPESILAWPRLELTPTGWAWRASLGNGQTAWAKLFKNYQAVKRFRPQGCKSCDATWKVSRAPAQNNMFRIGDAALRIDPSSGKGVLRAIMSAIMAVHLIRSATDNKITCDIAATEYSRWINAWFDSDTTELSQLLGAHSYLS